MEEAVTLPPIPPPEAPGNLRATALGPHAIELHWEHGLAACAYMVSARKGAGEEFKTLAHTYENVFLHENLPPESWYDYRVQSYHESGVSEPSMMVSAVTAALEAPQAPAMRRGAGEPYAQQGGGGGYAPPETRQPQSAPPAPRAAVPGGQQNRRFPSFSFPNFLNQR
jgi:hypothetical protein